MNNNEVANTNKIPIVSIIIIATNAEQLKCAQELISQQSVFDEIELIILENYNNRAFSSAATALNYGARKAKAEYLIFMHQDVYLYDTRAVEKCVEYLSEKGDDTILGVAGVCKNDEILHSDIYGKDGIRFCPPLNGKIEEAVSLDECFIAMSRSTWKKLLFDEKVCDDWHFYGVDICYTNMLRGGHNIVYPLEICHFSGGNIYSAGFCKTLKKVIKKYKGKVKMLLTPCVQLRCSTFGYLKFMARYILKKY